MNWFAIAVTVLQICAAIYYLYLNKLVDAILYLLYAVINVIIMNRVLIESWGSLWKS